MVFGFGVALVAYIIMAVVKCAFGAVHGVNVNEKRLSGYSVANEISGMYRGMSIAIDYDHWVVFLQMTAAKLAKVLKSLAAKVHLPAFRKHP